MRHEENPLKRSAAKIPSEERLRHATLGELSVLNGPIKLAEYNPEWPKQFSREAQRIRAALGNRAVQIEHVGSTSVPGLTAKPIIDILLVVADSADEDSYVPALTAVGYILRIRELEWHEHRMFKALEIDLNLHVFTSGSVEIDRMLLLRDRLRNHAQERQHYTQAKRLLADRTWKYMQDYADAKSEVIEAILGGARSTS